MRRPRPGEILVDPDQFALALVGPVRVPMLESRPPRVVVLRESGTRRWIASRTLKRHRDLTPILKRAEPLPRAGCFAVLSHPPLCEES
jgi:hypothetical protein